MRRIVFDSNVDPANVWYQANLNQDLAFDRNIQIWFGWLAEHRRGVPPRARPKRPSRSASTRSNSGSSSEPAGGVVGPAEWDDAFLYAGYCAVPVDLPRRRLLQLGPPRQREEADQAYRYADGPGVDNGFAVYNAVQCTDVQWPPDWATWEEDNWATYEQAPFFTWGNAWYNAPCLFWHAPAGVPTTVAGDDTPVLLIGETLDAATPFEGNVYVRSVFPNAVLISEPGGTTHAGSLFGNGLCRQQDAPSS